MKDKKTMLLHRISRLEGQLASVKRELAKPDTNCEQAAMTLKAASRSFASLRTAFVSCFLETKYISAKQKRDSAYDALLQVINS